MEVQVTGRNQKWRTMRKVTVLSSVCNLQPSLRPCTDSPLQNDSAKDGARRYMASSNLMSRSDMMINASITSFTVLQRSVKASRAYMVFSNSRIWRTTLPHLISRVMQSSALDRRPSMLPSMVCTQKLEIRQSLLHLHDKANNRSRSLTVHIQQLNLGEHNP